MCVVLSPPGWFCCQGNWGCTLSALPGGWWSAGSFDLMTPAGRCTAEGNKKRERKKKWKWVRVKQRDESGLAYYFSLPWGELPSISQEPVCSDTPQVPCSSCNLATITMDTCCLSAPAQQGVKELGGNAMPQHTFIIRAIWSTAPLYWSKLRGLNTSQSARGPESES